MGLRISIHLPGQTEITCEATEPALCTEVLALALRELPRDLIQLHTGGQTPSVSLPLPESPDTEELPTPDPQPDVAGKQAPLPDTSARAESQFSRYCAGKSPVGDMRRVVVASLAAERFLELNSISEKELPRLFDLAGWRQPDSFIQTLRNAARSKFRWLERVPGRAGYYSVTPSGIQAVVPDQGS